MRDYLAALEAEKKPGRRVSREELEQRLNTTREQIETEPDPAKRLDLIQKRLDIEERLDSQGEEVDLEKLEKEFVKVARDYAERKSITYTAFRETGVPAAALKEAGIPRTRHSAT